MLHTMRIEPIVAPEQVTKGIVLLTTIASTTESLVAGHVADLFVLGVQHLEARGLPQDEAFQNKLDAATRGVTGELDGIREKLGDNVADDISLIRSGLRDSIKLATAGRIDDADAAMQAVVALVPLLEEHFLAAIEQRRGQR